jgi:predicted DNA-binding transcriptional regulator AlpA
MVQRCTNPNDPGYRYYGGRGITVCERWRNSFEAFLEDMGRKPSPELSLDRIDNDKLTDSYSKENCRWATKKEQNQNRRPWKARLPKADAPASNNPPIRLIFKPELLALVGHSYGSIFIWMRKGQFPLARQIGPDAHNSKIAWFRHEVMAWLAARPQRRISPPPQRDGGKAA